MQRGGCSNSCAVNSGDDLQQTATVYGTEEKGRCFWTKVNSSQPQSEQDLEVDKIQFDLGCLLDSLLLEILARLPVQSVFGFKCVSKHWKSLISDPSFSRVYASRKLNSSPLSPFRILYRYVYVSHFQEIVDRLSPDELKSDNFSVLCLSDVEDQQQGGQFQFKVLAASNGLLLCCSLGPLIYYVCSPLTGQWLSLPRPSDLDFRGEGLATSVNEENVVTSYKVVRVQWLSMECNYLNFESFSSETGEWRSFRLSCCHSIRLLERCSPFLLNGVMHWFTCGNWMIAFDPYKNVEECRLIKLPEDRDIVRGYIDGGLYRLCDTCQGQLRYFEVASEATDSFCFSMWIMKDYDKAEWRIEHRATGSEIWSNDPHMSGNLLHDAFVPLAYHPFNLDNVYLRCVERSCVVAYDIQTKRLEVSCHPVGIVNHLSWRMVIPFVLPIWPTPVPGRARRTNSKCSRDGDAICESNVANTAY